MNIYGALAEVKAQKNRVEHRFQTPSCGFEMPLLRILHYPVIIIVCQTKARMRYRVVGIVQTKKKQDKKQNKTYAHTYTHTHTKP